MYQNFMSNAIEYIPFRLKEYYDAIFKMADRAILKNLINLALFELEAQIRVLDILEFDF